MAQRPTLVKGMRDYRALQLYRRNYMLSIIQSIYALYGFEPLETPALENYTTLAEKYGQEGAQLLFHVLKSGNFLASLDGQPKTDTPDHTKIKAHISDKGLRYDLTVPLVRHIATHQHQIIFPWRRYQIQPVWRADRPQKGRYREFLQCDADIIGSSSLLCEIEILMLINEVFSQLQIQNFYVRINHRGILTAIANTQKEGEKTFCTIVDKLEKRGWDYVCASLIQAGFAQATIALLASVIHFRGTNAALLSQLRHHIGHSDPGAEAIATLDQVLTKIVPLSQTESVYRIDPTLARGLTYYTGLVIEATVTDNPIGSLGGGGRYDHLGEVLGMKQLTGIGFSFGIDRIYEIMEQQQCFGSVTTHATEVLITNLNQSIDIALLQLLQHLRHLGMKAELYPSCINIEKQLVYAHKKKIPFVIILGEREKVSSSYTLKDMQTGKQSIYSWPQLCQVLQNVLTKT